MAISEKVWPFGLDLASTAPQRVAAINIVVSGLKPFPKMRYLRRVDPSTRRGFLNGSEAGGSFRGWIPLGVLLLFDQLVRRRCCVNPHPSICSA